MNGVLTLTAPLHLAEGSTLSMGNASVINIDNGGRFISLGTNSNPAMLTSHDGYYAFNVNNYGKVGGSYCIYEKWMQTVYFCHAHQH